MESGIAAENGYELKISPVTVDKLGVKLYDKVSAVVAELVANSYDADAEHVAVTLPLATELARKTDGEVNDHGYTVEVTDDGHGMTPEEAQNYFLAVGLDRRKRDEDGSESREKHRAVMGRKGIGKLAPFGICRVIEVRSAGGDKTDEGYLTSHFLLNFDQIMATEEGPVPLEAGEDDGTFSESRGTTIRLREFWPKKVPNKDTFARQMSQRFALADDDIDIKIVDSRNPDDNPPFNVPPFQVPTMDDTVIDLANRPVSTDDGQELAVTGWVGLAKEAYQNEEMTGVRIYARGKIVAITRDFEQPAGYTGEYTVRSYLVGEVHAEWLDTDAGDDLVRTDRQGIIWDSEYGDAMRKWGGELIKEVGRLGRTPRRIRVEEKFLEVSKLKERAVERFSDDAVIETVMELGKSIGSFAAEDELQDEEYIDQLCEVVLSVAPHRALMVAFQEFNKQVGGDGELETLAELFGKTRVAEMASYSQIASERVRAIGELEEALNGAQDPHEATLQKIIADAPYLIEPTWTMITQNQALKTFKDRFEKFFLDKFGEEVDLAIIWPGKRPDFILTEIGHRIRLVEIKKPGHSFDDDDFDRLFRYVNAFREFFAANETIASNFSKGWCIDLVADGVNISDGAKAEAFQRCLDQNEVARVTWTDFLDRAKTAHEQFLDARDQARTQE